MAPARGRALRPSQSCFTLLCQIQARNPGKPNGSAKNGRDLSTSEQNIECCWAFPLLSGTRKAAAGLRSATASYALGFANQSKALAVCSSHIGTHRLQQPPCSCLTNWAVFGHCDWRGFRDEGLCSGLHRNRHPVGSRRQTERRTIQHRGSKRGRKRDPKVKVI